MTIVYRAVTMVNRRSTPGSYSVKARQNTPVGNASASTRKARKLPEQEDVWSTERHSERAEAKGLFLGIDLGAMVVSWLLVAHAAVQGHPTPVLRFGTRRRTASR